MPTSVICIDANIVVRLILDPNDRVVWSLWQQWEEASALITAPALLHYEVTNAVYQQQRQNRLSGEAADIALSAAASLSIRLHTDPDLHRSARRLAEQFSLLAAYDAYYLATAEKYGAALWTTDKRLYRAVQNHLPWVKLVAEVSDQI